MGRQLDPLVALLRDLRLERGLSQRELAVRAGVSEKSISYWERGLKDPRLANLVACLAVVGARLAVEPLRAPLASHIHVRGSRHQNHRDAACTAATAPSMGVLAPPVTPDPRRNEGDQR